MAIETQWCYDLPNYGMGDTWAGFDDPNASVPVADMETLMSLPDSVYCRLHQTIFGESVGCLEVSTLMTLVAALEGDETFAQDSESEETLKLTVEVTRC